MDPQRAQMINEQRMMREILNLHLPQVPWIPVGIATIVGFAAVGYIAEWWRDRAQAPKEGNTKKGSKVPASRIDRRRRFREQSASSANQPLTEEEVKHDIVVPSSSTPVDPFANLKGEELLQALMTRADALKARKEYGEAEKLYHRLNKALDEEAKAKPAHAYSYRSLGLQMLANVYLLQDKTKETAETFEILLSMSPPEPDCCNAMLTLADLYLKLENFKRAFSLSTSALSKLSKFTGPQSQMALPLQFLANIKAGVARLRMNAPQEASQYIGRALSMARQQPHYFAGKMTEATSAMVEVYVEMGELEKARECADQYVARPQDAGMSASSCERIMIEVFYTKNQLVEAERRMRVLLENAEDKKKSPDMFGIYNKMAALLRETNRHEEALTFLDLLREHGAKGALVTASQLLRTRTAGVYYEVNKPMVAPGQVDTHYKIKLLFRNLPQHPIVLQAGNVFEAKFENLQMVESDPKGKGKDEVSLHTIKEVVLTEQHIKDAEIELISPTFSGSTSRTYCIFVDIYEDESKMKCIGHHHQLVWAKMNTDQISNVEQLQLELQVAAGESSS